MIHICFKLKTVKLGILANVKRDYELLLRVKKDVDEFMPIFMNNRSEYQLLDDVGKKLEGVN